MAVALRFPDSPIRRFLVVGFIIAVATSSSFADSSPPAGFVALFNGKDLGGWRGGNTFDPAKLAEMTPEARRSSD